MRRPRLVALAASAALVLPLTAAVIPAGAEVVEVPSYCGRNPKFLATLPEDAQLVEKKLHFHGTLPSGDVDANINPDRLFMNATPATGPAPKQKTNLGAGANDAYNKNPLATAWVAKLTDFERIVCAQVEFVAADTETFSTSLWIDQPEGTSGVPAATGFAVTPGGGDINAYTGTFGRSLDVEVVREIVVQVVATTSSSVLYDAPGYDGSLTYLTVVE